MYLSYQKLAEANAFTGSLPPFSSNWTWTIFAHQNQFTGTIPQSISNCSNLGRLNLGRNNLHSTIPDSFSTLDRLGLLDLSYNYLTGQIPNGVGSMSCLIELDLGFNRLTGTILNFLPFNYSDNRTCDSILLNDYKTQIEDCFDQNNPFCEKKQNLPGIRPRTYDPLVNHIIFEVDTINTTGLVKFSADQNFLNGNLQNLRNLTALIELSLSNNMFTSTIPSFFRNMTRMNYTDLSSNMLVGTIPSDLFIDMVNLSSLILNSNNFVGTIPYELPQNISDIDVSDNAFVGQIPETIFRLPDLNQLSASKNCISLNLPASICEAQSLRYLYISGLQQSHKCSQEILALGESYVTIPPCFWSSLDLQELIVAGNAFSGHMESFDMPNITKLDVSYNRLHGTIPAQVFNGKKMTEFQ